MSSAPDLSGYVDVATRIATFRDRWPMGSLAPFDPAEPVRVFTVGEATFLQYVAVARRFPGDPAPGIAVAWEPIPGRTPYTRDSEAQNAETAAWGRAIVAALAADTRAGVASADELAHRQSEAPAPAKPTRRHPSTSTTLPSSAPEDRPASAAQRRAVEKLLGEHDVTGIEALPDLDALTYASASEWITKLQELGPRKAVATYDPGSEPF